MKNEMAAFFPEYYLAKYGDLRAAYGTNQGAAWQHYAAFGIKEGRSGNPFFDPSFYRDCNPDLRAFDGPTLLDHWIRSGISEGRRGSRYFWINYYIDVSPDLKAAFGSNLDAAFEHWKTNGNMEGRITSPEGKMRIFCRSTGTNTELVVCEGESNDPDANRPWNTTGGIIGTGVGLVLGIIYGDPVGTSVEGQAVGHFLDREITRIQNDVSGPWWATVENGPTGEVLGGIIERVRSSSTPSLPVPEWHRPW